MENESILKIGHFLRFDKNALEFFLKCKIKNIFDTKIASKIVRTYTDSHGLKNLVQEFCNKSLDKRQGSSDWNKDIDELSDKERKLLIHREYLDEEVPGILAGYLIYSKLLDDPIFSRTILERILGKPLSPKAIALIPTS